jgi:hypothetical protein
MKIKQDCVIVTIEEKDFNPKSFLIKGTAIDLIIIPNKLKDKWEISELKMAMIPCLKTTSKIIFV